MIILFKKFKTYRFVGLLFLLIRRRKQGMNRETRHRIWNGVR